KHGRLHLELVQHFPREGTDDLPVRTDDLAHELRLIEGAAVRERRIGIDELKGRHGVVALTDARLVRLPGEHRSTEGLLLPSIVGNDAADLARQVDARWLPEAVLPRPIGEPIAPEHPGDLIEEGIARVAEATVDVTRTPATVVPLVELRLAERQERPGQDLRGLIDVAVG